MVDYLPEVGSIYGFVFYSILAYIFSYSISKIISEFVARNIDVEEVMKK